MRASTLLAAAEACACCKDMGPSPNVVLAQTGPGIPPLLPTRMPTPTPSDS